MRPPHTAAEGFFRVVEQEERVPSLPRLPVDVDSLPGTASVTLGAQDSRVDGHWAGGTHTPACRVTSEVLG